MAYFAPVSELKKYDCKVLFFCKREVFESLFDAVDELSFSINASEDIDFLPNETKEIFLDFSAFIFSENKTCQVVPYNKMLQIDGLLLQQQYIDIEPNFDELKRKLNLPTSKKVFEHCANGCAGHLSLKTILIKNMTDHCVTLNEGERIGFLEIGALGSDPPNVFWQELLNEPEKFFAVKQYADSFKQSFIPGANVK